MIPDDIMKQQLQKAVEEARRCQEAARERKQAMETARKAPPEQRVAQKMESGDKNDAAAKTRQATKAHEAKVRASEGPAAPQHRKDRPQPDAARRDAAAKAPAPPASRDRSWSYGGRLEASWQDPARRPTDRTLNTRGSLPMTPEPKLYLERHERSEQKADALENAAGKAEEKQQTATLSTKEVPVAAPGKGHPGAGVASLELIVVTGVVAAVSHLQRRQEEATRKEQAAQRVAAAKEHDPRRQGPPSAPASSTATVLMRRS